LDNFDLNLLRALVAIWREGHVGRAALALGTSQPALSAALKRLREQLGDPLFVKTRSGMQPTPYAAQLAPEAVAILDLVRHRVLAPQHFDPALADREFTLSTTDIGEMVFMPKLLRHLAKVAPGVRVRTLSGTLHQRVAAMERGEIDLLIGHYPDLRGADLFQRRLFDHGYVCLVRQGHSALRKGKISAAAYAKADHAVLRDESRNADLVDQHLRSLGVVRRVTYTGSHFLSLPFVVAASDLIATVPAEAGLIFSAFPGIEQVALPYPLPDFAVKLHWHRQSHADVAQRWLRDMLVTQFAGPAFWRLED
jgi:DNA-binding transcriptional LysR family regulator